MGIMMTVVCCIPYNVQYRRILYISYIIFLCIELLLLIIVFILVLTVELDDEDCPEVPSENDKWDLECSVVTDDFLRFWYITFIVVWAFIYIPLGLSGLQILYWGWKEQDTRDERREKEEQKKKEKKEKKEAKNALQLQQMMMLQQQQPG